MKKLFFVFIIAIAFLGCGEKTPTTNADSDKRFYFGFSSVDEFVTESGVRCVWVKVGSAGGLSCDFSKPGSEYER